MTNLVDKIIELDFKMIFRGQPYGKPIMTKWSFDTHSLHFAFFVEGQVVNMIITNKHWSMEIEERRIKLAQRGWQGSHA